MVALTNFETRSYFRVIFLLFICHGICNCGNERSENERKSTAKDPTRPITRIPQGVLEGMNMATRHERKIFAFKGIPYARPPVGNLRFRGPVPPEPWNGTLDASKESNLCPQLDGKAVIGDEDCLYLNVYTPRLPTKTNATLLPVIFFIYGGAYKLGDHRSERWGPGYLLDKDVILVIPSYRIGPLGFLSTGDEASPGNYGLKDMRRALEWNRENIRYFGGDPNCVTLAGGSAGAVSSHILALSDSTNGLFHRLITTSGALLPIVTMKPRKKFANYATRLGEYLGCPTNTSSVLVDCLRGLNVSQIVDSDILYHKWNAFPQLVWTMTIEPDIKGAVLTDHPANLIAAGKICDVPMMSNLVQNEGFVYSSVLYTNPIKFQELLDDLDTLLPIVLQYDNVVNDVTGLTKALKSYYFNDLTVAKSLLFTNVTQVFGDTSFASPLYDMAEKFLLHSKTNHYVSYFRYRGTQSNSYAFGRGLIDDFGAVHGDDLIYIFSGEKGLYGPPEIGFSETDWKIVDDMLDLWTSFARTGIPTLSGRNSTINWEPYSSRGNYLQIGNGPDPKIEVKNHFGTDRMRFCTDLINAANISWA